MYLSGVTFVKNDGEVIVCPGFYFSYSPGSLRMDLTSCALQDRPSGPSEQAAERGRKISSLFRESGCYNDSDTITYSQEMRFEKEEYKNHEKDRA